MEVPKEVIKLGELLSYLPSVGPKLSSRLAIYLSLPGKELASKLGTALSDVVLKIKRCTLCGNVTTENLCSICSDPQRNKALILVVEDPLDLINIESSGEFKGLYHVLGGVISPMNGVGPDDLRIKDLLDRIDDSVTEVILALNPNVEGDATSLYIKHALESKDSELKITRLAKGIPSGGDIEYVSSQTIVDSMKSRVEF